MTSTPPVPFRPGRPSNSFAEDCKRVLQGLRGVLTDVLISVGVDPARPQEVARTLGLHRNLTWKISKIVKGADVFAAVPHVPGRTGMKILEKALRKAGAPEAGLTKLGTAMDDFDRLVQLHGGDRVTLETVASGLVPGAAQHETMVQARRAAFRGNSATWSVQARVAMSIHVMMPAATDPRLVDLVQVRGLVDFRRLRPDVVWPLFRRQAWDNSGSIWADVGVPIEKGADARAAPLLREFCTENMPDIDVIQSEDQIEYELPAGEVGRSGEVTCVYGTLMSAAGSQYAEGDDRICELGTNLMTPVELMHTDLLVHESLEWAMDPQADVYSRLEGRPVFGPGRRDSSRLPIEVDCLELGQGLTTMATPHLRRYSKLLGHVFDNLGWNGDEFRGFRFLLEYPPIPAVCMLSMDLLPEGPG